MSTSKKNSVVTDGDQTLEEQLTVTLLTVTLVATTVGAVGPGQPYTTTKAHALRLIATGRARPLVVPAPVVSAFDEAPTS